MSRYETERMLADADRELEAVNKKISFLKVFRSDAFVEQWDALKTVLRNGKRAALSDKERPEYSLGRASAFEEIESAFDNDVEEELKSRKAQIVSRIEALRLDLKNRQEL